MFIEKSFYRRKYISEVLGGSIEDYLPHNNRKVVCGCFRLDFNPDAPDVILVGDKDDVIKWANVYRGQLGFVPIFIKRADAEWEYMGDYKVKSSSDDAEIIAPYAEKAGRDCIARVLFLQKSE